jgi:hypothetical protein
MTLTTAEISKVLRVVEGCPDAKCKKPDCLRCKVRVVLQGDYPKDGHSVTIGSMFNTSHEGIVEIIVNTERMQMPIDKAREVYGMLGGAIEAAITDEIVWKALEEMKVPEHAIGGFIMRLRDSRQGSTGVVYPS